MFRKINTKLLASIFIALLAIVVVIEVIDSKKGNRTFKSDLVQLDPDNVTSIEIYPKTNNGKLIKLFKENDSWKVESDEKVFNADKSIANRLSNELDNMKPKSVAATSKDNWKQFEVTDSLGTKVKVYNGTDLLANVVIGKFSFSQPRNMTSYIRLANDKKVYGVEGMLGMSFNRKIDSFRDRTIIHSEKNNWTKLKFDYPADSSFVLEKKENKWMAGEMQTDSAKVAQFFNKMWNLSDGNFVEKPNSEVTHKLTIEGNNQMQKIEIKGYKISNDEFIIETNQNPGTFINSKTSADKLFISISQLINTQE